jgi:hypothetical protein
MLLPEAPDLTRYTAPGNNGRDLLALNALEHHAYAR